MGVVWGECVSGRVDGWTGGRVDGLVWRLEESVLWRKRVSAQDIGHV